MKEWRLRTMYLICTGFVVVLGLGSRRYGPYLPLFVAHYAGDTLWGLMVFLGFSVLAPSLKISRRVGLALVVSCAIEVSQLCHASWLDELRHTTLGRLVLGSGFLWNDLLCYTIGIVVGAAAESALVRSGGSRSGSARPSDV